MPLLFPASLPICSLDFHLQLSVYPSFSPFLNRFRKQDNTEPKKIGNTMTHSHFTIILQNNTLDMISLEVRHSHDKESSSKNQHKYRRLKCSYCFLWKQNWKALSHITSGIACLLSLSPPTTPPSLCCFFCHWDKERYQYLSFRSPLWPTNPSQPKNLLSHKPLTITSQNKGRKLHPLLFYSLMQGFCPLFTHCLISHQRSICKLKDLYSVKYFTCHQPGAPGSLDVLASSSQVP